MNVTMPALLRPDEFPDADPKLLELINSNLRDLAEVLRRVPESSIRTGSFTSAASGVTTVGVQNPLSQKPQHVSVALRRSDLADFSAAWSWWFVMSGEQVSLKFIGLPASTKHTFSVEFF
jgi:hypothetical protein